MYKVLLVEDERLIRKGLAFLVDWTSLECMVPLEAANGKAGLKLIEEEKPDLVITDVKMPLMDGIQMIEQGQKFHFFASIIISGFDEFEYARTAMRLGVSDYLLKPVQMGTLAETIRKACASIRVRNLVAAIEGRGNSDIHSEVLDFSQVDRGLKTSSKYVSAMLRKVRDHYTEKLSLKNLSDELNISATYLNQKFKEETRYTFNDFLNRYRIQMSIAMLLEGRYKIYEISDKTGFQEYRYFSMVFKKYVGCTPTEFSDFNRHL
ncbi:MAG: response regulator [Clostridiales bacterium]|nr:response regulator [Clostridiales bacterium]